VASLQGCSVALLAQPHCGPDALARTLNPVPNTHTTTMCQLTAPNVVKNPKHDPRHLKHDIRHASTERPLARQGQPARLSITLTGCAQHTWHNTSSYTPWSAQDRVHTCTWVAVTHCLKAQPPERDGPYCSKRQTQQSQLPGTGLRCKTHNTQLHTRTHLLLTTQCTCADTPTSCITPILPSAELPPLAALSLT
jgi:hypothetical protein